MIRRRRPRSTAIPFSLDSFLDVVANVIGIIIRLILVAWVGARSYTSDMQLLPPAPPSPPLPAPTVSEDPLHDEILRHREELARLRQSILAGMKELEAARRERSARQQAMDQLQDRQKSLLADCEKAQGELEQRTAAVKDAGTTLAELQTRARELAERVDAQKAIPPARRSLFYRTPLSKPLDAEEILFECRYGRVTFIDIAALLAEVRRDMDGKGEQLRYQWQLRETVGPVGAFRLRYVVERERGAMEAALKTSSPDSERNFRYQLSSWEVEPVLLDRGESLRTALTAGSRFRDVVDRLDGRYQAVTFWVYPDSFELFRGLRDYLYDREVVVAGRPLPESIPIASSRHGTLSLGQ